ncbi:hypothetical protein, partial [Streptomyces rochei]|uniref:hypothetical protein n=1 Tax=Streptomyces rochei TaxID=1928 RepID=UPI0033B5E2F6
EVAAKGTEVDSEGRPVFTESNLPSEGDLGTGHPGLLVVAEAGLELVGHAEGVAHGSAEEDTGGPVGAGRVQARRQRPERCMVGGTDTGHTGLLKLVAGREWARAVRLDTEGCWAVHQ